MSKVEKQAKFALLAARLIQQAAELGYLVTLGDAYRDQRCKYGSDVSLHRDRLALDLNLFKRNDAGKIIYLSSTADHAPLGAWWKQQDPECEWGGEGDRNDGNHYSLRHNGRW